MNLWMESLKALLFGIVEGITEWLPISSTGHMILLDEFVQLQMSDAFKTMFNVVIQLGAILAVVVLYFPKLWPFRRGRRGEGLTGWLKMDTVRLWLRVIVAILPSAIVGARAYYVIFEWKQYFGPGIPWYKCLMIRDGGLAIYGAVIAALLAATIYCMTSRKRRAKLLPYMDIGSIGLLIGQGIGRWGNFFNREAHGGETTNFLRMGLIEHGQQIFVHPTFLYESVWNLVGVVILHFVSKKRKFDGQIILCYLAWYGLGRAFIEGLRTDSLYIGPFRVSQLLAAVTCVVSVAILVYVLGFKHPDPRNMLVNRAAAEQETASENTTED